MILNITNGSKFTIPRVFSVQIVFVFCKITLTKKFILFGLEIYMNLLVYVTPLQYASISVLRNALKSKQDIQRSENLSIEPQ